MTSPAIKLARECGWFKLVAEFPAHTVNYVPVTDDQLETFYTKAQAQALRDAASKPGDYGLYSANALLIRMAEERERGT